MAPRLPHRPRKALLLAVAASLAAVTVTGPPAAAQEPPAARQTTEAAAEDWVSVAAGGNHTCGIRSSGRLFCWGQDAYGQVGDSGTNTNRAAPVEVAGGRTGWASVTAGGFHTCARTAGKRLFCWGSGLHGQLGNNQPGSEQPAPVEVTGRRADWASVTAGYHHTCGRRTSGRLFCWGSDAYGQVGDSGTNTNRAAPVEVAGRFTDWVSVTAGANHTCGRRTSGRLFCWGHDAYGQVGDSGTNTNRAAPVEVAGGRTDWVSVTTGYHHTCGRRTSGRLFCWGHDAYGQVGDSGTNTNRAAPVEVAGRFTDWVSVSAGGNHTCARARNMFCWGYDAYGQVGDSGANTDRAAPVGVAGGPTDWVSVSSGGNHTCGQAATGGLYCWGYDYFGQVGDSGTNTNRAAPAQVAA